MRVTQKDIAEKLNLSQSLVAGVLGHRPGVWVSERNRQRILEAAREMGYKPNAAARALRKGKTNVIACVFFGEAGYQPIAEAMADALAVRGYDLLVKVVRNTEQASERMANLACGGVCDAVALWGLEQDTESPAIQLASAGVPFVVKGRFEDDHPDWVQIDFDHEGMISQLVHHLASCGHRRIACIAFDNDLRYTRKLIRGYRSAMERLGGGLVGAVPNQMEHVWALLDRWLSHLHPQQPTAIVNVAGQMVWEATELWLARQGRKIGYGPRDITMVGVSDGRSPLLFGDGLAYQDAELTRLATFIASDVLPKVAAGLPLEQRAVRIMPALRPLASRHLQLPGAP